MADSEEFYIIHKDSGQALYHRSFSEKKYDPDLFAGLLSAILSYAQAYSKNTIADFEMKKKVITIGQGNKYPLLFVYIVDKKTAKKKKRVKKMLKDISLEFEKMFPETAITEWNGNIVPFKKFTPKLEEIIHPWNSYEDIF